MTEVVKGVLGGAWELVAGWILPTALGMALFGILVLPSIDYLPLLSDVTKAGPADQALTLISASAVIGLTLSALQTPMYRILEGYSFWPGPTQTRGVARQQSAREQLRAKLPNESRTLTVKEKLILEQFLRFPSSEGELAPTRFGNAIRRFEYYGEDRYNLDTTLLWYQLRAVVPEPLGKAVDRATASVDFFVCLFFVFVGLGATALGALFGPTPETLRLALTSGLSILAAFLAYRAGIVATDGWSAAVRAVVDVGRVPLAKALGLHLPVALEEERKMWRAVGWLLTFDYAPGAAVALDPYRITTGDDEDD